MKHCHIIVSKTLLVFQVNILYFARFFPPVFQIHGFLKGLNIVCIVKHCHFIVSKTLLVYCCIIVETLYYIIMLDIVTILLPPPPPRARPARLPAARLARLATALLLARGLHDSFCQDPTALPAAAGLWPAV